MNGWYCYTTGKQITMVAYETALRESVAQIEERYGATYTEAEITALLPGDATTEPEGLTALLTLFADMTEKSPAVRLAAIIPDPGLSLRSANGYGYTDSIRFSRYLASYTVTIATDYIEPDQTKMKLAMMAAEDDWELDFYEDSTLFELQWNGNTYGFIASGNIWSTALEWLDASMTEASTNRVIEDVGQDYMDAAQTYSEQYIAARQHMYTYATATVEKVEDREGMIEHDLITEDEYPFRMHLIVVPTNESYGLAMNPYGGDDPDVPEGAYEIEWFCVMTKEYGGWRGRIVGTAP